MLKPNPYQPFGYTSLRNLSMEHVKEEDRCFGSRNFLYIGVVSDGPIDAPDDMPSGSHTNGYWQCYLTATMFDREIEQPVATQ